MLIDYESIIVIDGEAAGKIISGELNTQIVQKSSAAGFAENSFVRNGAVIQCISPSVTDGTGKVKFSVMYRPSASLEFEMAAVLFDSPSAMHYEIRVQNETVSEGDGIYSGFRITLSETDGKLNLDFTGEKDNAASEILDAVNEIAAENESASEEIKLLEQKLLDENARSEELLVRKNNIMEQSEQLRTETENISRDLNELRELEQKREVLSQNLSDIQYSSEKVQNLKNQLSAYGGILEYYRDEDRYITVREKLDRILNDIYRIENDISELAQKRAGEM